MYTDSWSLSIEAVYCVLGASLSKHRVCEFDEVACVRVNAGTYWDAVMSRVRLGINNNKLA